MNVYAMGLMASLITVVPFASCKAAEQVVNPAFVDVMLHPEFGPDETSRTPEKSCYNLMKVRRVTDEAELVSINKKIVQQMVDLDPRDLTEFRPVDGVSEVASGNARKPPEC
ncbi:MAG: hypothetical protein EON60_01665 [Alphaproteobacteria bacterium]|nr:MAG: hypothetical protein EON60_01665 [Alphaproteobacteria bacterium]